MKLVHLQTNTSALKTDRRTNVSLVSAPLWPKLRTDACFLWTERRLDQSRLFKQQQLLGKVSQFRFQGLNVQKQNSKPLLSPSVSLFLSHSPSMFSSTGMECISKTDFDLYDCSLWVSWKLYSGSTGLRQVPALSGSTWVSYA